MVGSEVVSEAVGGELKERTPHAENVNKLLGIFGAAHRPESATYAASHYDQVFFVHIYNQLDVVFRVIKFIFRAKGRKML